MFLEHEKADPNTPDTWYGQMSLAFAAWYSHEGVVKILLEREDLSPNMADFWNGQTPLSLVAGNGHGGSDGHDHARAENLAHARA